MNLQNYNLRSKEFSYKIKREFGLSLQFNNYGKLGIGFGI